MPLNVDCISMMKIAQSAAANTGIASVVAQGIQMSQGAKESGAPDPLDNIDLDEALRLMAENGQVTTKVIRGADKVAALRKLKAQAQASANVAKLAPAAVNAAQQLSQTNPQSGALGAMLGGPSQAGG